MTVVRRVWKILRFQAQTTVLLVFCAILTCDRPCEEVAGVELDPRFSGKDFHQAARHRIEQLGSEIQVCSWRVVISYASV